MCIRDSCYRVPFSLFCGLQAEFPETEMSIAEEEQEINGIGTGTEKNTAIAEQRRPDRSGIIKLPRGK